MGMGMGGIQPLVTQLRDQGAFGNPYASRGLPMQAEQPTQPQPASASISTGSNSPTGLSPVFSGNSDVSSSSGSLNSMPSTGGSGGSGGPFPLQGQYGIVKMANGGLTNTAQNMAGMGRDGDSMLVHMSPGEVKGLQALAMANGGSLSINPNTGLVEANFLKRILPMIAGAALSPFITPMGAAALVGGIETARTGDIGKGLLAGLGACAALTASGAESTMARTLTVSTVCGTKIAFTSSSILVGAAGSKPSKRLINVNI